MADAKFKFLPNQDRGSPKYRFILRFVQSLLRSKVDSNSNTRFLFSFYFKLGFY